MRLGKLTATLCAALAVLCLHASADEFVTEAGYLRVKIDGHGYRLESLVIKRADATGRLPVALVTHGTADSPAQRLNQHPDSIEPQARDFAARGYLAVAVMRAKAYNDLRTIRTLRNRIAHHEPIFARNPAADYAMVRELIEWRSPIAAAWVDQKQAVLGLIPKKP